MQLTIKTESQIIVQKTKENFKITNYHLTEKKN